MRIQCTFKQPIKIRNFLKQLMEICHFSQMFVCLDDFLLDTDILK